MTDHHQHPGARELGVIIAAIDSEVRESAVIAHRNLLEVIAGMTDGMTDGIRLGDVEIPFKALLPRDTLQAREMEMEFEVFLRDDGASLIQGHRLSRSGVSAKVKMKWATTSAPEGASLVRTKAESTLATEIGHG